MKKSLSLKVLTTGALLASGLFMTLPTDGSALATTPSTEQTAKKFVYKKKPATNQIKVPKADEIKTFEDVKKAAIALYNSPQFAPKGIEFKSKIDFSEQFTDYAFNSMDITEQIPGYTFYGRTVEVWSEDIGGGVYKNTITVVNDRDKAEEIDWNNRMNSAEKYIVENYKIDTEYDVILAINDFVGEQISYGKMIPESNPYIVQRANATTCTGYTDVAAELFNRFGIETRIVVGSSSWSGAAHSWNAVKVGGSWYYTDATAYDGGDKKSSQYVLMTNAEGSTPLETNFKATDTKFQMSMAKAYSYEKSKKVQTPKK